MRLFCLPYAGGGASAYLPWKRNAPAALAVVPVQLPGRETRLGEPMPDDVHRLVSDLADALAPCLDRPYGLFGYSMGAKLAFAVARQLADRGLPPPAKLGVAANTAPDAGPHCPGAARLPDPEFAGYLRQLGGTPEQVLSDPDLSRLLFPILRADFHLLEQGVDQAALDCPIVAYAGLEDDAAPSAAMLCWRAFTRGGFTLRVFPGGHFFFQTAGDLLQTVSADFGVHAADLATAPVQTAFA
jgi:medium-chain acyl-[acyl-carrier-protein] hydrolase